MMGCKHYGTFRYDKRFICFDNHCVVSAAKVADERVRAFGMRYFVDLPFFSRRSL